MPTAKKYKQQAYSFKKTVSSDNSFLLIAILGGNSSQYKDASSFLQWNQQNSS